MYDVPQGMDLPVDIWAVVRSLMAPQEWTRACGTCRAAYALKRPLVMAEVCCVSLMLGRLTASCPSNEALLRRLQLDRWPTCHSLCLNLAKVANKRDIPSSQLAQIALILMAGHNMPLLHCLHLIGRPGAPLMQNSIEGMVISCLAKHLSVLTIEIRKVLTPLNLPKLQHLVLQLTSENMYGENRETLIPAACVLKGLKTLYVTTDMSILFITGPTDLTACTQLQVVAVQDVHFKGLLALPAGCQLHVNYTARHLKELTPAVSHLVNGLTLRHYDRLMKPFSIANWYPKHFLTGELKMSNLTQVRIVLDDFSDDDNDGKKFEVAFGPERTPSLEVLELNVHWDLAVFVDPALALKSLVLITTKILYLDELMLRQAPPKSIEQVYLQSRKAPWPQHGSWGSGSLARVIRKHVRQGYRCCIVQIPNTFNPYGLQECCCRACPSCLLRAGVPILCDKAWSSFEFHEHKASPFSLFGPVDATGYGDRLLRPRLRYVCPHLSCIAVCTSKQCRACRRRILPRSYKYRRLKAREESDFW